MCQFQSIKKLLSCNRKNIFIFVPFVIAIVPDTSLMRQPKYSPLSAGRLTGKKSRFSHRDGYAKRGVPRIGTE